MPQPQFPSQQTATPSPAATTTAGPRPSSKDGRPLSTDVQHFIATCPLHGETTHAKHKVGLRAGRQRYRDRCLACHAEENGTYRDAPDQAIAPTGAQDSPPGQPQAQQQEDPRMPADSPDMHGAVRARPIAYAEVQFLVDSSEPQSVFAMTASDTLTPARLTATTRPSDSSAFFAAVVDDASSARQGRTMYRSDASQGPVGHFVKVDVVDDFGTHLGISGLFTTEAAERSAGLLGRHTDPGAGRRVIYVADPQAEPVPLTPVFGAMLTFSGVVADIDPVALAERAERALRREFGDALGSHVKCLTQSVEDRRVDVHDVATGRPLAYNILAAETRYLARPGGITVTETDTTVVVGR